MTTIPLSDNPDELYTEAVARVQLVVPGFVPRGLTEQLLRTFAGIGAEVNANLASRLAAEVRQVQGDLLGIPIQTGVPASSTITIPAIDSAGHTLDAGARVWIGDTSDSIECETVVDLVIAPGSDSGTVAIQRVEVGAGYNGATGVVQVDPLDWIDSESPIVLNAPLAGGVDAETVDVYDPRLVDETQLLAIAVSNPDNASILARRNPAVGWAYTVDHYDANTGAVDQDLTFSTIVADDDGLPVGAPVLAAVLADLQARRETNYRIRVKNPLYVDIDATAQVVPEPGWTSAQAIANATAAMTTVTSPATHLAPPHSLSPNYVPPRRIYSTDLIAAAKAADGVLHVIPSTFVLGDGSSDHVDLPTPIYLPRPRSITVTAVSA